VKRRARAPWEPADPIRFVVVEAGAEFPDLVTAGDVEAETEVVQQTVGDERPAEIALRAVRRLATIERTGRRVAVVVLGVGRNADRAVWSTRELITRTVVRHMEERGGGQVLFCCHGQVDPDLRSELLALGRSLTTELGGGRVSASVRFSGREDVPARSGVRLVAREPESDDEREVG
jgi:hypothetical protein